MTVRTKVLMGALALLTLMAIGRAVYVIEGTITVHDPDRVIVAAHIEYGNRSIPLRKISAGLYIGIPPGDGSLSYTCKSGKRVPGDYVTPGMPTKIVIKKSDCAVSAI